MSEGGKIRVGCRGTQFCRAQTQAVIERLNSARPDLEFEVVDLPATASTEDAVLDALSAGMFDLHCRGAREVPLELPDDVQLAACTERSDPFDVLVAQEGVLIEDLPAGSVVGVESLRVKVQIEVFREDLELRLMNESVDQLFEQLNQGVLAAFIVAAEDVETCGWEESVAEVFPPDIVLPAAGQGSFALLTRSDDETSAAVARSLDHEISHQVILAERAFLRELNVRPSDPVAVHGSFDDDTLVLEALLGDAISGAILRDDLDGEPSEKADLGIRLAKLFMADGARDYIAGYK
ncbi:MAG: porphobilinogen deaminase [Gemmatimonadota bacterium]|nr:MAG: porphobilinogen deaminase [Gemmatimonadota bacterium]